MGKFEFRIAFLNVPQLARTYVLPGKAFGGTLKGNPPAIAL